MLKWPLAFITFILLLMRGNLQSQVYIFSPGADSATWLRVTGAVQTWVRYTDHNPGSALNYGGPSTYLAPPNIDIGIRRARFQLFGPVAKRAFIYAQFGINNFTPNSARKTGAFFHDLAAEYAFVPRALSFGAGLTGWGGPSRYSSPSIASTLMYDAPLFQQTTNDVNDQFLRKLSVYAKGKLSRLDYRVALNKPMAIQNALPSVDTVLGPVPGRSVFSPAPPRLQYQAYINWQFADEESNLIPYTTGSYLGTRNVFNIGAGIVYQDKAMRHLKENGGIAHTAMALIAVDLFYDRVINAEKKTTLTFYAGLFNLDFGPAHIRPQGVMNPVNASVNSAVNKYSGAGNAFPMYGSGQVIYFQTGYKFRDKLFKELGTIQPYADIFYGKYEALTTPAIVWNAGFNWLVKDHNAKISLNYQERPVFIENAGQNSASELKAARRGMVVLQCQVSI